MNQTVKIPKVSVCVITYNQEQYIRQCLQSIVEQQTDFDFEVIVGDDCSTDGTRAIVTEFAERYPRIVRTIFQEKNTGGSKNYLDVHASARGIYIAHVDGDDYCLPGKLQAQCNFLDINIEFNVIWHRMLIINEETKQVREDRINFAKLSKFVFRRSDMLKLLSIGVHSSKMYRSTFKEFIVPDFDVMDFFTDIEHVSLGRAGFISDQVFGAYRQGNGIASSGIRSRLVLCKTIRYFAKKYPEHRLSINTAALLLFLVDIRNGRRSAFYFLSAWVITFHPYSFWGLVKTLRVNKMLRV